MGRLMNYLRGSVRVRAEGPFPERLLNLCAQRGVEFWGVEWPDQHTLRLTTRRRTLSRLEELGERVGCQVWVEGRWGLVEFLLKFRSRYAFLLGLTLSLCAVGVLSRFVLTVEVVGNERLSTAVILDQLRREGVRPGVYGPAIDQKQVAQEVRLALDDLAWVGVNRHGTRVEVIVRENVPTPEPLDETGFYHVVAQAGGIVTQVEAEQGDPLVAEGDTVAEGDVLISGTVTMEPPIYSDLPPRYYQTHARGRVWARTWRTLTAAIPRETWVKDYTGEKDRSWRLRIFDRSIEIFGNSSISGVFYDRIAVTHPLTLPDGRVLPLSWTEETRWTYVPKTVEVDLDAARTLLEGELLRRLRTLIGEDGQVDHTQYTVRVEHGMVTVTLLAECREEIGKELPAEPMNPGVTP